jgi:hypothetical protein
LLVAYANTESVADRHSHGNSDGNCDRDCDSNRYFNAQSYTYAAARAHTKASPDASATTVNAADLLWVMMWEVWGQMQGPRYPNRFRAEKMRR